VWVAVRWVHHQPGIQHKPGLLLLLMNSKSFYFILLGLQKLKIFCVFALGKGFCLVFLLFL
jgi:hypothetical protein